jgi:hypothetical protein
MQGLVPDEFGILAGDGDNSVKKRILLFNF